MAKLLFDSLRGVTLQKNLRSKVLSQKVEMPKKWLRNMCGIFRTDFLKVYQSISGITRHPLENQKNFGHLFIAWVLDAKIRL
jgi:hypothetical protein